MFLSVLFYLFTRCKFGMSEIYEINQTFVTMECPVYSFNNRIYVESFSHYILLDADWISSFAVGGNRPQKMYPNMIVVMMTITMVIIKK